MALITFQDLPSTSTPLNASNLNNNFTELDNNKLNQVKLSAGRYIKNISLAYYNNKWCLKVLLLIDGNEYIQYYYSDDGQV